MNPYVRKNSVFLLVILLVTAISVYPQVPDFSKVINVAPGNSVGITNLIMRGTKVNKGNVIAWFPKDSLSVERMNGIVDTLAIGVKATEQFIRSPQSWQAHPSGTPFTFYFRPESFVSHASLDGFVSIPFWRIKQGKSPWLHEALHEMLNSKNGTWLSDTISEEMWAKNMPVWLSEGLPDYISMQVSKKYNLSRFDVFSSSFMTNVDSACNVDLKGSKADYILSFIGRAGAPSELSGNERRFYAPTFYHCSCSFVKYLAERFGIDALLKSHAAFPREREELEKRFSVSLEELKKDWLVTVRR